VNSFRITTQRSCSGLAANARAMAVVFPTPSAPVTTCVGMGGGAFAGIGAVGTSRGGGP
jgi:hypothetical protein